MKYTEFGYGDPETWEGNTPEPKEEPEQLTEDDLELRE